MSVDNAAVFIIALSVILRAMFCAEETTAPAVTGRWEPKERWESAFCSYEVATIASKKTYGKLMQIVYDKNIDKTLPFLHIIWL